MGQALQSEFTNGLFNATLNIFSSLHQAELLGIVNPPTGMYVGYDSASSSRETRRGQEQPDWPLGPAAHLGECSWQFKHLSGENPTPAARGRGTRSSRHTFEDSNKQSTGDYFRLRPSTFYVQVILCLIVFPPLGLSVAVGLLYPTSP